MSVQTVDFQKVKEAAAADVVIRFLDLSVKSQGDTYRGRCPICRNDDPRGSSSRRASDFSTASSASHRPERKPVATCSHWSPE